MLVFWPVLLYAFYMNEKHKTSPKDIFLQLLIIVALYASATAFLTILFQFITIRFPDPLSYQSVSSALRSMRFAVSSLIIVFPVYIWALRFLEKAYKEEPERKDIRIRKWLVYFTLFAAGLIIIGDLVALVNSFLNGELTARFVLKVLSVFLVSGAVFWYYYWDMKDERPAGMKFFQWGVVAAVGLAIIGAFFMVGSPQQERLRQFDDKRVSDLQSIQWQIVNYWQQKGEIPGNLLMLEDDISGFTIPVDPQTGNMYEYRVNGRASFTLCADFTMAWTSDEPARVAHPVGVSENWRHDAGRACFERAIDPDLYPVREDAVMKPAGVR
jgi:hypothetical protein